MRRLLTDIQGRTSLLGKIWHSRQQAMTIVMSHAPQDVTSLLIQWSEGDRSALDRLMPVVYDELHRIAQRYFRHERSDNTLQPTALVNEAYIRLVNLGGVSWQNRAQFFGIAATTMRRILVERARARNAAKR